MKNLIRSLFLSLTLVMGIGAISYIPEVEAQSKTKGNYKKARVLSSKAAKIITQVVEALERLDDEGKEDPDFAEAKRLLTDMELNKDTFKSYDRSVILMMKTMIRQCAHMSYFSMNLRLPFRSEQPLFIPWLSFTW
jgi:hypothetical protein